MQLFNAAVYPSPSANTKTGKAFIKKGEMNGSLGIAISEAVEAAITKRGKYVLGSVLNAVLAHQTIIGEETIKQLQDIDEEPTDVIACFGGGSNFGGLILPFYREYFVKRKRFINLIAAEPSEVPSLSKGEYKYDYGDTAGLTPLLKMYTLGKDFIPPPIYAGGLRYHGASPLLSLLRKHNIIKPRAHDEQESRRAAEIFARTEGIVPAPETSHAIASAIDRAIELKKKGEEGTIIIGFSGHGLLDLTFYEGKYGN